MMGQHERNLVVTDILSTAFFFFLNKKRDGTSTLLVFISLDTPSDSLAAEKKAANQSFQVGWVRSFHKMDEGRLLHLHASPSSI
jgi:hypothetical protein